MAFRLPSLSAWRGARRAGGPSVDPGRHTQGGTVFSANQATRWLRIGGTGLALAALALLPLLNPDRTTVATSAMETKAPTPINSDLAKIKHVIIIMQENRSFDEYFGTFPGADGIP